MIINHKYEGYRRIVLFVYPLLVTHQHQLEKSRGTDQGKKGNFKILVETSFKTKIIALLKLRSRKVPHFSNPLLFAPLHTRSYSSCSFSHAPIECSLFRSLICEHHYTFSCSFFSRTNGKEAKFLHVRVQSLLPTREIKYRRQGSEWQHCH